MSNKAEDARAEREATQYSASLDNSANLERIADSLDRLVIAADSIATALSLQALTPITPRGATGETLDELMLRHERITRDK